MGERDAFGREQDEDSLAAMGWKPAEPGAAVPTDAAALARARAARAADDAAALARARAAGAGGQAAAAQDAERVRADAAQDAARAQADAARRAADSARARATRELSGLSAPPPPAADVAALRRANGSSVRTAGRVAGVGCVGIVVAFLAVCAVVIGGVWVFASSADHVISGAQSLGRSLRDSVPTTPTTPRPSATPQGVGPGSMLRPTTLAAALKRLPSGRILNVRVAPDSLDAQVARAGKLHIVHIPAGGSGADPTDVVVANVPSLGPVHVDPAVPSRIARAASRRAGRSVKRVSYLVLLDIGGHDQWELFFDDGRHFSANAAGHGLHRVE